MTVVYALTAAWALMHLHEGLTTPRRRRSAGSPGTDPIPADVTGGAA